MARKRVNSFAICLLLVSLFVVTFMPRPYVVKADVGELGYFVVTKSWVNDTDENGNIITETVDGEKVSNRPSSINICIEGSDGSVLNDTLRSTDNWAKIYRLPISNSSGTIRYTVYEVEELDKYVSNATSTNKLEIKQMHTGTLTDAFRVDNTSGFDSMPSGTITIDQGLKLSEAQRTITGSFEYETNTKVYNDVEHPNTYNTVEELIYYKGQVNAYTDANPDNSISGSIELLWKNKATDLNGNKYDVKITISNIQIRALANMNKGIAIVSYNNGFLEMQSYVRDFSGAEGSPVVAENLVGVKADITIQIVGLPNNNYVKVILDDIDIPDLVDHYRINGYLHNNQCYGLGYPYAESVVLNNNIASDIFINNGKTYLTYDANTRKFASVSNPNDGSLTNKYSTLMYLASANSYSFTWAGSDCGTAIMINAELPGQDKYMNTIVNTSGLYVVKYFYQKDNGTYDEENPDEVSKLVMVKPGTLVSVENNADLEPKKENYFLDTAKTNLTEEKEVTTDHTATAPQVLNVYFKKAYTVIYHDNVEDKIWNKDNQTNKNLDYDTPTPAFDTSESEEGIQPGEPFRQGYKFLGWSLDDPNGPVEEVPAKVTKNADYWAHWEPRTDTKYKVQYYYEVDGKYPSTPDFTSSDREGTTNESVSIIDADKVPAPSKPNYYLNEGMTSEWKGIVAADGSLILKVYFKEKAKPSSGEYKPPVTGIK